MLLHPTRTPRDFCVTFCSTPASNSVRESRLTLRSELYPYCFVPPTPLSHNLNLLSLPTKQTSGHARLVPGAWPILPSGRFNGSVGLATRPVERLHSQPSIRPIIPYQAHTPALRLYARSDTTKLVVRVQLCDRRQREYHA